MNTNTATNTADTTLQDILHEIRLLRNDMRLFLLPEEDIEGYEHPAKIKKSYEKAIQQYPPAKS